MALSQFELENRLIQLEGAFQRLNSLGGRIVSLQEPEKPFTGMQWFDLQNNVEKTWDGTQWVSFALTPSGVVAGSYSATDLTVNQFGIITSAASGSTPFPPLHGCALYTTGNSILQNTYTPVTFTNEWFDPQAMHSNVTDTSRIYTIGTGAYTMLGNVTFDINGGGTYCSLILMKNGSSYRSVCKVNANPNSGTFTLKVGAVVDVVPGDYFELVVYNLFGGTVTLSSEVGENVFSAIRNS